MTYSSAHKWFSGSCVGHGLGGCVSQLPGSSLIRGNHQRPQFLRRMQPVEHGSPTGRFSGWGIWAPVMIFPAAEKKVAWFRINTQEPALDRLFRSHICIIALTQYHSIPLNSHPVTLPARAHCVPCPGLFIASSLCLSIFPFPLFSQNCPIIPSP